MSDAERPQKQIVWVPPDRRVISDYAGKVAQALGFSFEERMDFEQFMTLICSIKCKQLNKEHEASDAHAPSFDTSKG